MNRTTLEYFLVILFLVCCSCAEAYGQGYALYWVESDGIYRSLSGGAGPEFIIDNSSPLAASIALDESGEKLYWLNHSATFLNVFRSDLDGNNPTPIVFANCGIGIVNDIDIDPVNGKLYWAVASDCQGRISRSNLDGSNVESVVVPMNFPFSPLRLALDPAREKVYWTDSRETTTKSRNISRADYSGDNIEILTEFMPWDIAIDSDRQHLYWVESDPLLSGVVRRSDLDVNNIETLVSGLDRPSDIALDTDAGYMYWTERGAGIIKRAKFDGSSIEEIESGLASPSFLDFIDVTATGVEPEAELPEIVSFSAEVYPNPAQSQVTVVLDVTRAKNIELKLIDVLGRTIISRGLEFFPLGTHRISVSLDDLTPGLYFLQTGSAAEFRISKLVVTNY